VTRSQNNGTTILLGLEDYKVAEVWEWQGKGMVKTEAKEAEKCPRCGSSRLYRHGRCKPREILHTWSNGKKVFYLELHRRRWRCSDCKRTFTEGGELLRPRSRLTGRLKPRPYGSSRTETSAR